jgi:hypothetical protein
MATTEALLELLAWTPEDETVRAEMRAQQAGMRQELAQIYADRVAAVGAFALLLVRASDPAAPAVDNEPFALDVFRTDTVEDARLGEGRVLSRVTTHDASGRSLPREALMAGESAVPTTHTIRVRNIFQPNTGGIMVRRLGKVELYAIGAAPRVQRSSQPNHPLPPMSAHRSRANTALINLLRGFGELEKAMRNPDLNPDAAYRLNLPLDT